MRTFLERDSETPHDELYAAAMHATGHDMFLAVALVLAVEQRGSRTMDGRPIDNMAMLRRTLDHWQPEGEPH